MRITLSAIILAAALSGATAPAQAGESYYPAGAYAPSYAAGYAPYGGPVYVSRYGYNRHGYSSDRQRYYAGPPRRFPWTQAYVGPVWRLGAHSYATIWD